MGSLALVAAILIASLSTASSLLFWIATFSNPYSDITNAWTTIFGIATSVVAVAAWLLVRWLLKRSQ